jgi:hypothetical protein
VLKNTVMSDALSEPARAVLALLRGHTDRSDEKAILELLERLSPPELRQALRELDLRWLLGDVDDHLFGPKHRSALVQLLAYTRLADLDVPCRERLLGALQAMATTGYLEDAATNILLGTSGADLRALKRAIDARGTEEDLGKLVFSDIDDEGRQTRILEHFAHQAAAVTQRDLKIVSDVDDTFYANWKDKRYPARTVYPGVLQVLAELDHGTRGDDPAGDLMFVTARPEDGLGLVETRTRDTLGRRGAIGITVFTGNLGSLFGSRVIARKKLENFERISSLYPEADFVLFGDTGQGDVAFGRAARELVGQRARAIVMHDVVDTPVEERKALLAQFGIAVVDTYLGAALHLHRLGLVSREGLERIRQISWDELALVHFEDGSTKGKVHHLFEVDDLAIGEALGEPA